MICWFASWWFYNRTIICLRCCHLRFEVSVSVKAWDELLAGSPDFQRGLRKTVNCWPGFQVPLARPSALKPSASIHPFEFSQESWSLPWGLKGVVHPGLDLSVNHRTMQNGRQVSHPLARTNRHVFNEAMIHIFVKNQYEFGVYNEANVHILVDCPCL